MASSDEVTAPSCPTAEKRRVFTREGESSSICTSRRCLARVSEVQSQSNHRKTAPMAGTATPFSKSWWYCGGWLPESTTLFLPAPAAYSRKFHGLSPNVGAQQHALPPLEAGVWVADIHDRQIGR